MAVTFSNRFKLICLWSWYVYSFLLKLFVLVVGKLSFFGVCGTLFFIHFRAGELHVFFVVSGCRCAKGQGTKQGSRGPCTSTAPWSPASYARCQVLTSMSAWLSLCAFGVQESLILDVFFSLWMGLSRIVVYEILLVLHAEISLLKDSCLSNSCSWK